MTINNDLWKHLQEYRVYGIQHRRHLHSIPELGREEFKTSTYCQMVLRNLGYQIRRQFSTGFIADLNLSSTFRCIAFRADMDALPAHEKLDVEYKSQHKGKAHLCGHDIHMAVALTTARFFSDHRSDLQSNIRFIFQPSEELLILNGGAKGMVDTGCLNGVDEVYGLHNEPTRETGTIALNNNIMSSNGDGFEITLTGRSAHASTPEKGLDTIRESCRLIDEFNRIIANDCSPMEPAFIAVGTLEAGEAANIVPEKAKLTGSIRSFNEKTQTRIIEHLKRSLKESKQRGFTVHLNIGGCPGIRNTSLGYKRVITAAENVISKSNIDFDCKPMAASEDFSYYTRKTEGAFFFLGSGNNKLGMSGPLHSNPFLIDEKCILYGVAVFASLVL